MFNFEINFNKFGVARLNLSLSRRPRPSNVPALLSSFLMSQRGADRPSLWTSVTRFGELLPKWLNLKIFDGLFLIRQNIKLTLLG